MSLAGSDAQAHWRSVGINNGVHPCWSVRLANGPCVLPVCRDRGPMLVHAHDRRIDHLHRRIMSSGQHLHDPVPDAGPPPANEPIVASGTGSVGLRQIAPRCARPQDPEGTIEETPVIYARDVAWFVREHRFDDAPFAVAQFISMTRGSTLGA